jgi:molybdopterin molybdotransferase
MQEDVERNGATIKIIRREAALNLRRRGEDVRAGELLVPAGRRLTAGQLALLATVGFTQPLVNPRLRIRHFTTGDEIIPPDQVPQPGQVRDSNSSLIRGLLQPYPCDLVQSHIPENFAAAKQLITTLDPQPATFDLLLVSGGASVGEKDFTRPLLEWLGFETVFAQVEVRPGKPLIFGINDRRVAFGLPGNPLSHFVCFHFAVATALARIAGESGPQFLRGRLAAPLTEAANPRETLWPAHLAAADGELRLRPLPWASAGSVTCFAEANALLRVPADCASLGAGTGVDFLPAGGMLGA